MTTRQTRNISLTPELDAFIDTRLSCGEYGNASEVVRTALKLLRAREGDGADAPLSWLRGGGECGALMHQVDWSSTALGCPSRWSAQLRATTNNVLNSPVPKVLMWGPEHVMIYNDGYVDIAGANHPRSLGGTVPGIWPEIWDFNRRVLEKGLRGEITSNRDQPMTLIRDGVAREFIFDLYYTPVFDEAGVGGVLCTVVDDTDRFLAEKRLAYSENELRTITDGLPVLIAYVDSDHIYRFANSYYEEWVGVPPASMIGRHIREVLGDETYIARQRRMEQAMSGEAVLFDAPMRHRSGDYRATEVQYLPRKESDGSVAGFHVLVFDIEDRVRREETLSQEARRRQVAEDQLRHLNENLEIRVIEEIAERRQAEMQLAQSQKMEAIGKLTGGVAHDFNNLLQVVSGNLQLLSKDTAGNERAERRIANAMAGVSRGSKLAAQLLAFGRRQALEPKVVNVARFVRNMDDILRRAIGEEIEIETVVAGGLWNTFIDPSQVENALLNLAINARDAMDGQGKLTIELGNASLDDDYARVHSEVTAGQYVMLAVSDTGCGMSADLAEKVFEPFFSTKSEGKGSGLGLSMVYGFIKQSGGHVKIYSEVGEGTTIKLYFPRSSESEDIEVSIDSGPVTGGSETVLVVEDDDEVRATVVELLSELGYRVLKSVDAASALNVIESGIPIDVLFTDVVMPGRLKSPELARMAKERLPKLAVLFTSGYTENSIVHGGRLDAGVDLLSKPYTREALARKIRQVISNHAERQVSTSSDAVATPAEARTAARLVLLVEDDPLIRMDTAEMLEDDGLVVVEAGSAEDAMAALKTTHVDVLVTDVNLPGLSGIELASKAREIRHDISVVFATGDAKAKVELEGGGSTLVVKPYDAKSLRRAIDQATQLHSGSSPEKAEE
jgi:putative addiction module CopG family antidote